jgi:hypothetical protein
VGVSSGNEDRGPNALFERKDAGTVVPITISGTRTHLKYGVDFKGILTRKVQ